MSWMDEEATDKKKKTQAPDRSSTSTVTPYPGPSPSASPDGGGTYMGKAVNQGSKEYVDSSGATLHSADVPSALGQTGEPASAKAQGQILKAAPKAAAAPKEEPKREDYPTIAAWRDAKVAWMKAKEQ